MFSLSFHIVDDRELFYFSLDNTHRERPCVSASKRTRRRRGLPHAGMGYMHLYRRAWQQSDKMDYDDAAFDPYDHVRKSKLAATGRSLGLSQSNPYDHVLP